MKRFFLVSMLIVLTLAIWPSAVAEAAPHTTLTPVKATHYRRDPRVRRHHAHKAAQHHSPKRHSHAI
jgi:hypothetical protein